MCQNSFTIKGDLDHISCINTQDKGGWTALHLVALRGCMGYIQALLTKDANPNIIDMFGNIPLFCASNEDWYFLSNNGVVIETPVLKSKTWTNLGKILIINSW